MSFLRTNVLANGSVLRLKKNSISYLTAKAVYKKSKQDQFKHFCTTVSDFHSYAGLMFEEIYVLLARLETYPAVWKSLPNILYKNAYYYLFKIYVSVNFSIWSFKTRV
jgi:hypothetical protein